MGETKNVTREELFKNIVASESDSMDFAVSRNRTPNMTFGKEPLEELMDGIKIFMLARLSRSLEQHPEGHEKMRVTVKVEIDGESGEVTDETYPWFAVDSERRKAIN